jgi:hypothetical protein
MAENPQSFTPLGAEAPFDVVGAAHLPGELVQAAHAGGRGVRARFSRVHLARRWSQRERLQAAFLSFRMTMKSSEGEGETRESPPDSNPQWFVLRLA